MKAYGNEVCVQMPRLAAHMEEEGVLPTMYCSQWFLTLYAYTLPIDHLLRVWDVFLLEGPKVLFRYAEHCTADQDGAQLACESCLLQAQTFALAGFGH